MKKSKLKMVFDKIMLAYPKVNSLVCYTEAVFAINPTPKEIKRGFYKYVDKTDYAGFKPKEVIKDTFTDMLDGIKTLPNERLDRTLYENI